MSLGENKSYVEQSSLCLLNKEAAAPFGAAAFYLLEP